MTTNEKEKEKSLGSYFLILIVRFKIKTKTKKQNFPEKQICRIWGKKEMIYEIRGFQKRRYR